MPTPRGGGLAITSLTIVGFVAFATWWHAFPWQDVAGFTTAALVIGVTSLIDDVRSLSACVRFFAHALSALIATSTCGYVSAIAFADGSVYLGVIGAVLTLVWIVGLTNAYNFMDGIDGIAGGQALVAGAGWAILGARANEPAFLAIGALIAATSLGFLAHNWAPAHIFMGDVGSAFLGFSFATLPLLAQPDKGRFIVPAALFVWPFLFDTTLTFIRRLYRRENAFAAHRSHLYQRLNIAGYSHNWISTLYILLAIGGAAAAIAFPYTGISIQLGLIAVVLGMALALWRFVLRVERSR
ncbi:MAG TPA: glycosyltransferase family 4 protein [Thermoanaerobaculia bacterium]|nr:glycosyltransferase family 4 protein [Thermoanaerobaculia bacterium]